MEDNDLKKRVLAFLREESVMSVAINNAERPVSTILLFALDDDFTFYFATHKESIKSEALAKDNKISMSVWAHNKMMVQASGISTEVMNTQEVEKILDKLAASAANIKDFWPPVLQITGQNYTVYSIKTTWLRVLDLSNKAILVTSPFTQLI